MKKMHKILVVAVIIAVVAAATAVTFLPSLISPDTAPGSHELSFEFDGIKRNYRLHIPLSYDRNRLTSLVIVLHGWTETVNNLEASTGFTAKSDKEGFIVVYPEGVSNSWNALFCCGTVVGNIDDVGFINELINRLQEKLKIDSSRIYVTGLSNGAMMAYRLAAEISDRIAAIAPVAGTIGGMTNQGLKIIPEPSQPVSVIAFHGTNDNSVPYNGGAGFLSVAESISFWVEHDKCSTNPLTEESPNGRVIKDIYTGGINGTEVVLYTLVDGGHVWPTPATPGGITATDIIWDFFFSHPKQ